MDPRILIFASLLSCALASDPANPAVAPFSGQPDTSTRPVADTSRRMPDSVASAVARQPKGLSDSTPSWRLPLRDGSSGGALREAFRKGDPDAPWTRVYEFDGMWEEWSNWPSLPLQEKAVRPSWTGSSLAGASDAGPLQVVALARRAEPGFGGLALRRELVAPSPLDTPLTQLQFWRGALASYRFGLDFSRAVAGPWGVALRMGARSAQGRSWVYRDQIQDMFQGSMGRSREDLPAKGRSPGQDDVQWETVVSRSTPGLLVELGWSWVDLQRGIPHPFKTWTGTDYAPYSGRETRSGWFGRILSEHGGFRGSATGRLIGQDWLRAVWTDSAAPVSVQGAVEHQEGEIDLSWGGSVFRAGTISRAALRTGNADTHRGTFQEDQERAGVYAVANLDSLELRLDAGWNRLNDPANRTSMAPDGAILVDWNGAWASADLRLAREAKLPDWEQSILPDPLLRSIPSRNLSGEGRWTAQSGSKIAFADWFSLDAGAAGVLLENAIQPARIPTSNSFLLDGRSAMVLANATGTVLGWSARLGTRLTWKQAWFATQWAVGQTMAPGEPLGGARDLRYPAIHSRTTLGWDGPMLAGRAFGASSVALRTWSSSSQLVGTSGDGATLLRSPPGAALDWENRFRIRTFELFWRLENLLNDRQVPAAGWTPPGIRSGWGVTWNFGG